MISVDQIVDLHLPQLQRHPWLSKGVRGMLRRLLHEQSFRHFAQQYPHLEGFPFVEQVLEHFAFSYAVRDNERERIPARGRVVIIANHPLGSLDGLALLNLVGSIRSDVKIVANGLLATLAPLQRLLLPVTVLGGHSGARQLKAILEHLRGEGAVIIFPAGEVSRLRPGGVCDGRWHSGFLRLAAQTQAPIVPIHIDGRNSALFYGASLCYKPLATLLLVQEMFGQHRKSIALRIGHPIPHSSHGAMPLPDAAKAKLFCKHLYRVAQDRPGLLHTETAVAHPVDRSALAQAVGACALLGQTPDGKRIHLFRGALDSPVLREVGRLRELAFRAVGEGSGRRRDLDRYDLIYDHLILWDPQDLEIVGAYRMVRTAAVVQDQGVEGLYTHSLFQFGPRMVPYLQQGLELGRSFVQPRYWGRRSLDYLWFGIGAYVRRYPECRYLFGPVSLSRDMPQAARDLLVHHYRSHYGEPGVAEARRPYVPGSDLETVASGDSSADFVRLKHLLAHLGCSVPTLYKQYTEVAEPGGVRFLDFGVDPEFSHCVDGLVLVDVQQLKAQRRERYIGSAGTAGALTAA
ncbi:MAG: lysophospholipid acyltransferase family protein [Proteobacteria bacterium]|nr:lysophospholipid acyltransferase family protein [Pseudomonadota bacterium]